MRILNFIHKDGEIKTKVRHHFMSFLICRDIKVGKGTDKTVDSSIIGRNLNHCNSSSFYQNLKCIFSLTQ